MPILLYLFFWIHPFFMSVTEAEYDAKEKSIGISVKLFNDDLEATLKRSSGQKVDILQGDKNTNVKHIQQYFSKHFKIASENKSLTYTILGYEKENDVIYVFIEASNVPPIRQLQIDTDLLYDHDKAQINLIHFKQNGKRETQKLTYPDTKALFRW